MGRICTTFNEKLEIPISGIIINAIRAIPHANPSQDTSSYVWEESTGVWGISTRVQETGLTAEKQGKP